MTRILIISDSHGETGFLQSVLSEKNCGFDLLVHLGDGCGDLESVKTGCVPVVSVRGNMDFQFPRGQAVPDEVKWLNIENFKILITHGHKYKVHNGFDILKREKADIVFFGHTHTRAVFRDKGTLYFNPGALKNGEYGMIALDKGTIVKTELASIIK